ncbi:long-chain-fatty-acid--CoA ligase [Phytohabitans kaempferiae]|uniref:Long-chain-fatty-acid--CoA ligase n=1 Tax=Phytohabitans kaempferiae TaxID=1620943 RepID=A0ABV6MGW6_9ACTN
MFGHGMTMSDVLARTARRSPDAVVFVFDDQRRSYREADLRVTGLARALADLGVGRGDRVAVLGKNRGEVIETWLATLRLGAIAVPLNFRLVADEIAYMLGDSEAKVIVVDEDLAATVETAKQLAGSNAPTISYGSEYERIVSRPTGEPLPELEPSDLDPAYIMYTSGTTGRPKGAVLTHRNLMVHAFSAITTVGNTSSFKVWMSAAPLFHVAGVSGSASALMVGGTIVIPRSGSFDPRSTLKKMADEKVTSCFMVPSQWAAVCNVPDLGSFDLSSLRRASWGAAPATTTLLRTMIEKFPTAEVSSAFGQTECSPVTCLLRGEDSIRKLGSVGKPIRNVEIRVVDEDMVDVKRGEVGEIVYRSPMVMKEYWRKPDETAEAFRGGWFHSGDLVRQDEEGYVYVVDRKKDMIISGGENIYCAEVENVLATHPKVSEVALIGVPDEKWGEVPMALVVPLAPADPPTFAEIESFSRERLAGFKRPKHLVVIAEMPRNPSGKVLKTQLRQQYATIGSTTRD